MMRVSASEGSLQISRNPNHLAVFSSPLTITTILEEEMLNRVFWSVVIILCFGIAGFAQTVEGVITGRVEDTSGARIPGVSVTLSSRAIQGDRSVISEARPRSRSVRYQRASPVWKSAMSNLLNSSSDSEMTRASFVDDQYLSD